jgi:lipopolysaccharide biosynthesis protein
MQPTTLLQQLAFNTSRGHEYEADDPGLAPVSTSLIKLIAFYLPQFHPIPENDRWWGKGFTEWTNVTKAIPRFKGHYQPRLPGHTGFYDLRLPNTLREQASMAKKYGIHGFCFHHYWFGGRRLLELAVDTLLANPDIELPFCVNWANENWTRHWDGREKDILINQRHSPEDDIAFARSMEPLFRDPRYIRIDNRPLVMIYRPGVLPDAKATVTRWRDHFECAGIGEIYVAMAQAFYDGSPEKYGMDAVVGFPPFWAGRGLPRLQNSIQKFDPAYQGNIVDYDALATATIASYETDVKLFPGVCPNWDNEARQPGKGFCFTASTPAKYGRWLKAACEAALAYRQPSERFVFINAWNEWAEGAYLEPDRHFGFAYLAETARVLRALSQPAKRTSIGAATPVRWTPPVTREPTFLKRAVRRGAYFLADAIDKLSQLLRQA